LPAVRALPLRSRRGAAVAYRDTGGHGEALADSNMIGQGGLPVLD
jgi:hypothetical protein